MRVDVLDQLAEELFAAVTERTVVSPISQRYPECTVEDAYRISRTLLDKRLATGDELVGKKIGVTSKGVQKQLNVFQPDFGFLTKKMQVPSGAELSHGQRFIQPRAEGEIAVRLSTTLRGPGVTDEEVRESIGYVFPCIELVDSRIRDWQITIIDTVADNASCGAFVLGDAIPVADDTDFASMTAIFEKNGARIAAGSGRDVIGTPIGSLAWLANTLGSYGIALEQDDIVLTGALVPLEPVDVGDEFHWIVEGLGDCRVSFGS
ncbi:2-keto-4-pentenoate hydratase [Lentisalinibacter orientalis]|uniref:2-keto-4-pentenoate hydratase n=1 Tax=Lentisalinibacter orientalis TaxID=2992241 RepID=UPI00386B29D2